MNSKLHRRLANELKSLHDNATTLDGVISVVVPDETDMTHWKASITGPPGTPYEQGVFNLRLAFPSDYPLKPPRATFETKILHPNVYPDGSICVDILSGAWHSNFDVALLLGAVRQFLSEPNPNSPANLSVADLYRQNINEFNSRVRMLTAATVKGDHETESRIFNENVAFGITSAPFSQNVPSSAYYLSRETVASVRFEQDFRQLVLTGHSFEGYQNVISDHRRMTLTGTLIGPKGTRFENYNFDFVINFSNQYPAELPSVTFDNAPIHPNVNNIGQIEPQVFANWYVDHGQGRLSALLLLIRSLFLDHNPNFVVNSAAPAPRPKVPTNLAKMRLQREALLLGTSAPTGISAAPIHEDNILNWSAVIVGPLESAVYSCSIFELELDVPESYPFEMPQVRVISDVTHPKVDSCGRIMSLEQLWQPCMNLSEFLVAIQQHLTEPQQQQFDFGGTDNQQLDDDSFMLYETY